jgi:hypothetical protein
MVPNMMQMAARVMPQTTSPVQFFQGNRYMSPNSSIQQSLTPLNDMPDVT